MPRKQAKPRSDPKRAGAQIDTSALRMRLIEEHQLQESIAWQNSLRAEHLELWRKLEAARHARNQANQALNQKLRSAGCAPVTLELSLPQKIEKLRRLQARNRAEIANSAQNHSGFPRHRPRHSTRKTSVGRRDDE